MRDLFGRRRAINTGVLLLSCCLMFLMLRVSQISFVGGSEWTGWTLFTGLVVLLSYAVRRRLSTLNLGRMAVWLQIHLYLGFFTAFLFLLHIGWRVPNGWFDLALTISLLGVVLTGVLGIFWSRRLPTLLTALGEDVLYERIGGFTRRLQDRAETLVLETVKASGSREFADFYQNIGHDYFCKPRFQWSRLYRKYQPQRKIERELDALSRYNDADGLRVVDELRDLVRNKSLLDAHYTLQGALRYWLFVHLAFALSLVPLVLTHIVLVYNFSSI